MFWGSVCAFVICLILFLSFIQIVARLKKTDPKGYEENRNGANVGAGVLLMMTMIFLFIMLIMLVVVPPWVTHS